MGKLLNYLGESKILKRIADVLNVKDVKVNNVSVVDNNGDANISVLQSDWNQTDNTQPDYIKNKPTAPGGQVQSDWAQTDNTQVDYIKNKPTIPTATQSDWAQTDNTQVDYIKNKPTIPDAQVNSDWDATSGVAEILNKPTIPTVNNNTITIQENGNNVDTFTLNQSSNKTIDIPVSQSYYGTCADTGDVVDKSVTVSNQNFKLAIGAVVSVRFSNANSASNVTLNVNNTGANSIYYNTSVYTGASATVCGNANNVCTYIYDGTYWVWLSHSADNNTTYSAMSSSELTTGTATNLRSVRADYLKTGIDSLIDTKINALDVTGESNISASKTIKSWSETNGEVSVTTQDIQIAESQVTNLTTDLGNKASSTHVHGNITNDGKLQTTDVDIASGDKLIITDSSDSDKVARASVSFDGSTTTTALTPKGTFETFSKLTLGTSSTNAYRGDRGNTAYSHATDSGRLTTATSSGLYKVASTTQGHIASLTEVVKADITGLGIPGSDTKNTAGSTNSSSKLFLIGATSQAANPQTYSHDTAYVGTDGHLYSDSKQVVNVSGSQELTNKTYNGYTLGSACAKDVASSGDASTTQVVMGNDTRLTNSRTPTSHPHGNITNGGTITSDTTLEDGDKIVIIDATNNKVARSAIAFNGSTTTKALTPKGTFETFVQDANYVHTDNNYTTNEKNKLSNLATVATSGSYNDLSNKPTIPAAVAVKGDAESSYSTGNVNLTPAKIGALSLSGGTVTGNVRIAKVGTTSSVNSYLYLGNNKDGSAGGARGIIDIFSSNTYRTRIWHDTANMQLTDDRDLYLPDKDGTIALTSDIKTYTGAGLISVNSSTNEISTTAEENQNAFSTVVMDDGAVAINMNASSKQDSITFKAGTAIVLSGTTLNKTITIDSSDQNVKQTDLSTSTTGNYRVLLSSDTSNSERTANVYKNRRLLFYPSTSTLSIIGASYRSQVTPNYVYVGNTSAITGARLYAAGDQDFWMQASNEANLGVKLGTYETTPAWAFAPMTNNTMRLGSPSLKWTVVYATNSAINTSDRNEKENIVDLDSEFAKDFIMDLKPVSYKRIEGDRTHYGLIAQDVEDTLTKFNLTSMDFGGLCKDQKVEQIYKEDEEGNPHYEQKEVNGEFTYGLRYEEFISPLIKTVQKQQEEIESLKAEISELKKLWAQLQS